MERRLILDTNVFCDLGAGLITLSHLQPAGETLLYSPLTVFEIAGKWSSRTFYERRAAANAILASGATELPDQDTYLTRDIFKYALHRPPVPLKDAVKAMAGSRDIASLTAGVNNFTERVVRKVNADKIARWRSFVEGQWVKEMTAIQLREIPRFQKWSQTDPATRKQAVPHLTGTAKTAFLQATRDPNWGLTLLFNCHRRALLGANNSQPEVSPHEALKTISAAAAALECYCGVYTQYLVRLLIDGALPDENDSGDIELFPYAIDDDHVVVTSERKWKRMAEQAGFANRVKLLAQR